MLITSHFSSALGLDAPEAHFISVGEYTTFLNAVAEMGDFHALYADAMESQILLAPKGDHNVYLITTGVNSHDSMLHLIRLDAIRYCNWLENSSLAESDDEPTEGAAIASTESGSYELQGNQVISTNAAATYHLIDTDENATSFAITTAPQRNQPSIKTSSPLMMFGGDEEKTPSTSTPDTCAINRGDTRSAAGASSGASQITRGIPCQGIAEDSSAAAPVSVNSQRPLTLQDFRAALANHLDATRFVLAEDGSIQAREEAGGNRNENLIIIDALRNAVGEEYRATVSTVIGQFNLMNYRSSHLSGERLRNILRRIDPAISTSRSSTLSFNLTRPPQNAATVRSASARHKVTYDQQSPQCLKEETQSTKTFAEILTEAFQTADDAWKKGDDALTTAYMSGITEAQKAAARSASKSAYNLAKTEEETARVTYKNTFKAQASQAAMIPGNDIKREWDTHICELEHAAQNARAKADTSKKQKDIRLAERAEAVAVASKEARDEVLLKKISTPESSDLPKSHNTNHNNSNRKGKDHSKGEQPFRTNVGNSKDSLLEKKTEAYTFAERASSLACSDVTTAEAHNTSIAWTAAHNSAQAALASWNQVMQIVKQLSPLLTGEEKRSLFMVEFGHVLDQQILWASKNASMIIDAAFKTISVLVNSKFDQHETLWLSAKNSADIAKNNYKELITYKKSLDQVATGEDKARLLSELEAAETLFIDWSNKAETVYHKLLFVKAKRASISFSEAAKGYLENPTEVCTDRVNTEAQKAAKAWQAAATWESTLSDNVTTALARTITNWEQIAVSHETRLKSAKDRLKTDERSRSNDWHRIEKTAKHSARGAVAFATLKNSVSLRNALKTPEIYSSNEMEEMRATASYWRAGVQAWNSCRDWDARKAATAAHKAAERAKAEQNLMYNHKQEDAHRAADPSMAAHHVGSMALSMSSARVKCQEAQESAEYDRELDREAESLRRVSANSLAISYLSRFSSEEEDRPRFDYIRPMPSLSRVVSNGFQKDGLKLYGAWNASAAAWQHASVALCSGLTADVNIAINAIDAAVTAWQSASVPTAIIFWVANLAYWRANTATWRLDSSAAQAAANALTDTAVAITTDSSDARILNSATDPTSYTQALAAARIARKAAYDQSVQDDFAGRAARAMSDVDHSWQEEANWAAQAAQDAVAFATSIRNK